MAPSQFLIFMMKASFVPNTKPLPHLSQFLRGSSVLLMHNVVRLDPSHLSSKQMLHQKMTSKSCSHTILNIASIVVLKLWRNGFYDNFRIQWKELFLLVLSFEVEEFMCSRLILCILTVRSNVHLQLKAKVFERTLFTSPRNSRFQAICFCSQRIVFPLMLLTKSRGLLTCWKRM